MKLIVTVLNLGLIAVFCYLVIDQGIPKDSEGILLALFLVLSPALTLWYIHSINLPISENIIALYFKRKALEEKLKIAELQKDDSNKGNV